LGARTDTPVAWMLLLSLACVLAVLAAIGWRVAATWPQDRRARPLAGALGAATLIALVVWTTTGPLAPRWASRAGTPATLLASVGATSSASGPTTRVATAPALPSRFSDRLDGSLHQHLLEGGSMLMVDIRSKLTGQAKGSLEVQIEGQPVEEGGVAMTASRVALGPPSEPLAYRGELTSLSGSRLLARVSNGTSSLALRLDLAIDQATGTVHGSATAQPVAARS
jgi:hypothetical protein